MSQGLVVYAKNKQRVSAFYQMTLGLLTEASDTFHDLLRGHGHEIVVHAIPQEYATDITIEQPPRPREDTPSNLSSSSAAWPRYAVRLKQAADTSGLTLMHGNTLVTRSSTAGTLRATSCSSSSRSSSS